MYFKSLEMFGFKSFADRTRINFEPGITTIIGPNGCGKSNIADAVKWVLGEQSAKALRGSRMEDVIFNGTDSREPLGYAEVSLTLSNEAKFLPIEYDEITITRRLYRSGESEYLINKNPVRLKDIDELFMGSGIGTSAYSLIEQGQIDRILSSDPEDRRIVFEEASGITRYKTKKREAIRRLEYTEQNLVRINDIIKEVQRQINSIERQAKRAKRYQELFSKLKDLDTRLAAHNYKKMQQEKDAFENEKGSIKDNERKSLTLVGGLNKELEGLREKSDNLNRRISRYSSDHREAAVALERDQDRIGLDRERVQELYKYEAEQKNEIETLEARVADIAKAMSDMTQKLSLICQNTKSKENLLAVKDEELSTLKDEIVKKTDSIRENKLKVVDMLSIQSRLRNEITKISSDMQNVFARLRRLNLERENVSKELSNLEKDLSEARSAVNITISKIETLEGERIVLQNNLKKQKESFELLEKEISDSKNHVFSLSSKLNLLRDLVKRHEGFTGGTQILLNSLSDDKLNLQGLCEPLAELLEPHRGYEAACEAALLASLQTLVVDDWKTAFEAIDFLKEKNSGKATFTRNVPSNLDFDILAFVSQSVSGNILDFMRFDPRYRPLFTRLLKSTFLIDGIEAGIRLFESLPENMQEKIKLVTQRGDIITKDTITGGGTIRDFTTNIIGRQAKIKKIEDEIAELERNILRLKQELNNSKEIIDQDQSKIKRVEDALRSEEIDLAQKRSAEANLQKERERIKEEGDLINLEIEESMLREDELKDKKNELSTELSRAEEEEADLQNRITEAQRFVEDGTKRKEGLLVGITQIQTELSSLTSQEDESCRNAQAQKGFHQEQLRLLDTKKASLEESARKEKEVRNEIKKLEADSNCLKERSEVIGKELKILDGESLELKSLIDEKEKMLNEREEDLNTIKDRFHSFEMDGAQLSFRIESLRNKISQIYKVDLKETLPNLEKIQNPQTIREEVDKLTQMVEKIGPVNLVAIDEHKELEERFSFLKCQEEDLVNAKESLLKAVRKINQTTKTLFMETFNNIQAEFKNYFRFLFGGGKAEIVLLDEKDVLESGIEIIVRPPGKKLQTISLLSGGEKALTAIALLFAIFKVKPSPFCLLDEIDAPLDDSNIGRFSKALEEFARKSQFIIITHNKRTITISDVMYGITMEQSKISKIISVKFAERRKKKEPILA